MSNQNLRRDEAATRSALITTHSYDVSLDVRQAADPDVAGYTSRSVITFSAGEPGASTFLDFIGSEVHSVFLNGKGLAGRRRRGRLPDPAGQPAGGEPGHRHRAPRSTAPPGKACTASSTPPTASATSTPSTSRPTPAGSSPTSNSPTSRRNSPSTSWPPPAWQVASNGVETPAHAPHQRSGHQPLGLRPHQGDVHLHHHGAGRPVLQGRGLLARDARRRHPPGRAAGPLLPRLDGAVLRPRGAVPPHQERPGLLQRALRLPVPVGQVRPGLRARIQPRRHGEPGPGDLHGKLRLHLPGRRFAVPGPRQHPAARDGPHVVRRPRHDAVVGRSVAQGVLRGLHGHPRRGPHHGLGHGLGELRQQPQGLGLRAGPAAHHAPDRRRHPRPRGRQAELRRHHLRQGRLGAQAAGRLRGLRGLHRRLAPVLQGPRLRQHHPGGPAGRAQRRLRPGPRGLGPPVAADLRHLHPHQPEIEEHDGVLGAVTLHQDAEDPTTGRQEPRPHRLRIGLYDMDDAGALVRTDSVETDVDRRPDRGARPGRQAAAGPAAGQRRGPQLRQGPAGPALRSHGPDLAGAAHRSDGPGPVLDRALGFGPGRRHAVGPLRGRRAALRPRGDRHRRAAERPGQRLHGDRTLRPGGRAGRVSAAASCPWRPTSSSVPRRAPTSSWPGRGRSPRPAGTTAAGWTCSAGILDGSTVIEGLAVDAELRWNLWHALAANGQATAAQLDAELARDNTAAGKSGHATALAARPEAAVKEAAWNEAVHGTALSNQLLSATIAGFNTGPAALLDRFVDPYFECLEDGLGRAQHRNRQPDCPRALPGRPGPGRRHPGHSPGHRPDGRVACRPPGRPAGAAPHHHRTAQPPAPVPHGAGPEPRTHASTAP